MMAHGQMQTYNAFTNVEDDLVSSFCNVHTNKAA